MGRVPEPVVSDFVKSLWQDMLEITSHELQAGDGAGSKAVFFAVLIFEGDRLIVHGDDSVIGDGDSKDVSGQVVEDSLLGTSPWQAICDPFIGPDRVRNLPIKVRVLFV